jgi:hypothetical protein
MFVLRSAGPETVRYRNSSLTVIIQNNPLSCQGHSLPPTPRFYVLPTFVQISVDKLVLYLIKYYP